MSVMVLARFAGRVATGARCVRERGAAAMRFAYGEVNIYYHHDVLTPGNVRVATYGTARSSPLVPEVGDVLNNFPGYADEPITVRVTDVKMIGDGVEAYDVRVTTVG